MSLRRVGLLTAPLVIFAVSPAAAATSLPKPGFYRGGAKDSKGVHQLGMNVYKVAGKTLVLASTRIPTAEFVCKPSVQRGAVLPVPYKARVGGMKLKSDGRFTGKATSVPTVTTVTGRFTSPTKVDVTFSVKGLGGLGVKNELCDATRRLKLTVTRQTRNTGLPF